MAASRVEKPWAAWIPAPLERLYLIGGLLLAYHYAWLLDDAFVYFRYIDNLLFLDLGLVYNQGEYVEGFSSPFWTLLLIPLRAAGLDYWFLVRAIACIAFLAFGLLLVRVNREFVPQPSATSTTPILDLPLAFLAMNYGVSTYVSSGVESPLIVVLSACYALFVMRPGAPALQIALGLSPLVRPELVLPLALALGWAWLRERRLPWLGIAVAGIGNLAWLTFRIYYYADLLPNTFYLKDAADFAQGFAYLRNTTEPYLLLPLAIFGVASLVALRSRDQNGRGDDLHVAERLAMLAIALPVLLYVVRIGGDPRHFRYLIFPFCLCVCALGGLPELLYLRFAPVGSAWVLRIAGIAIAIGSALLYPPQLSGHPAFAGRAHETIDKINDAYGHRMAIHYEDWAPRTRIELQRRYREQTQPFAYKDIVDTWICMASYIDFDKRIINNLGLTDPILARTNMKADRPAHKFGLYPLAADLRRVQESSDSPGPGMYREAASQGIAADWIVRNLAAIEEIERKVYNRHDFVENLGLAFRFPDRIDPEVARPTEGGASK